MPQHYRLPQFGEGFGGGGVGFQGGLGGQQGGQQGGFGGLLGAGLSGLPGGPAGIGIGLGANLLGGAIQSFAGRGRRRQARQDFEGARSGLQSQLGQNVFNPLQAAQFARRGSFGARKKAGARFDKALGLDTGAGLGHFLEQDLDRFSTQLGQGFQQNAILKSQRDQEIRNRLFGEASNRFAQVG